MPTINKIGVIGAGNMGSGIAQKLAQEGLTVVMVDMKEDFIQRGLANIKTLLQEAVERRIFTPDQVDETLGRISTSIDLKAVADADLVIEAVFEDKAVKSELFNELDRICTPDTLLATNTSSFYVREFARQTDRADRFIGLHYFYHPAKNRLLEVIPHDGTSSRTLEKALLIAKLHGKTAIVVKDAPGFAVNRFFVPFLNEAVRMLEEDLADIPAIEAAAKRAFHIGMGPFELMNVTGIPIAVHASATLGRELGPFYDTAPRMKAQMDKGQNWDLKGDVQESGLPAIIDRFYGVCLGVAAALVDEKVASIEDVDRGAKIGLRWRLGPFEIMNRIGIEKAHAAVLGIVEKYPDFTVPAILAQQRQTGTPFEFKLVDLDFKDEIAYITLNRPEAMNALNPAVVEQLEERFLEAERNPDTKAIVFQGAGKAFVAGADIRYFVEKIKADSINDIVAFTRKGHQLLLKIENSSKLTIALLDGLSLGGGSELALACQAIAATPAGSLAFPETGIGIFPGLGGMPRLARHVGAALAKYYIFTGTAIPAQDAKDLGIFTCLVPAADVEAAIKKLAVREKPDKFAARNIPARFQVQAAMGTPENIQKLLNGETPQGSDAAFCEKTRKAVSYKAPLALRMANEIIDQQHGRSMSSASEIELLRLAEIFATADAMEGLSSLGRKRPAYQGK